MMKREPYSVGWDFSWIDDMKKMLREAPRPQKKKRSRRKPKPAMTMQAIFARRYRKIGECNGQA
jgi:hypothetical protein